MQPWGSTGQGAAPNNLHPLTRSRTEDQRTAAVIAWFVCLSNNNNRHLIGLPSGLNYVTASDVHVTPLDVHSLNISSTIYHLAVLTAAIMARP